MPLILIYFVSTACLASLLISKNLWLQNRNYPLIPLIENLSLPSLLGQSLFYLLLISLLLICHTKSKKIWDLLFLGIGFLLVVLDFTRLQPWFYQYWFFFLLSFFYTKSEKKTECLSMLIFMLACIYVWSGLKKLNPDFIAYTYVWMLEPLTQKIPSLQSMVYISAALVPFIEAAIGLGLLSDRYRKLAAYSAIAMHTSILILIGPFGKNWNAVVWPWNICMISIQLFIIRQSTTFSFKPVWNSVIGKIIIIFFAVLPIFSFWGYWDQYPSFALYTGNSDFAEIRFKEYESIPEHLKALAVKRDAGNFKVSIKDWAMHEMHVPPYPEIRAYKQVYQSLCQSLKKPEDSELLIAASEQWNSLKRTIHQFNCTNKTA